MSAKRIECFDIAKALAMVLIIAGHSLTDGYLQDAIYTFHVPLFFFVSGYFFKARPLRELARRGVRRLMAPYLLTSAALIVVAFVKGALGHGWQALTDALIATIYCCGIRVDYGSFYIPSCGAIWFLPALFVAMLLVNIAASKKHSWLIVTLAALVSWASAQFFILPFGLQSGGFASLFLYSGMQERNSLQLMDAMHSRRWIVLLLLVVWVPCFVWGGHFEMVICNAPFLPLNIIGAYCGVYLFLAACRGLEAKSFRVQPYVVRFGQSTMIVLCVHLLDIRLFPWGHYAWLTGGHAETLGAFAVIMAIRLGLACLAVACQSRSKLLRSIF